MQEDSYHYRCFSIKFYFWNFRFLSFIPIQLLSQTSLLQRQFIIGKPAFARRFIPLPMVFHKMIFLKLQIFIIYSITTIITNITITKAVYNWQACVCKKIHTTTDVFHKMIFLKLQIFIIYFITTIITRQFIICKPAFARRFIPLPMFFHKMIFLKLQIFIIYSITTIITNITITKAVYNLQTCVCKKIHTTTDVFP